jgi:hypothetical protein
MKKTFFLVLAMILGLIAPNPATADSITFAASSSTLNLAASATFEVSGTNLIVTLTNTSRFDVEVPADVLTAVFFTVAGNPALTSVSAVLGAGSSVFYDPDGQPAGGVVGGEWAYLSGLVGAPGGANQGISSSGLNLLGDANFPGPNLAKNSALDGLQYGILSAGDNPETGNNGGIMESGGLIRNAVTFTLGGLPVGFDLLAPNAITHLSFQYGTDLSEPNLAVPEPATLFLLGSGLIGIGIVVRRKFKK